MAAPPQRRTADQPYGQGFESEPRMPPAPRRHPQRLRPALPVDRPRHRARAQGGGRRRRLRQDRRRTEGPARGTAPPDGVEPARASSTRCARISSRATRRAARPRASSASTSSGFRARSSRSATSADDRSVNMLRLEIEQMKSALDTLAREETVRSVDRRWDAFDQRFNDFEHRISAGAAQGRKQRRACGADRPRSSRSARPWATCPNRCRCARWRKRCARLPARLTISSSSRAAAPRRPSPLSRSGSTRFPARSSAPPSPPSSSISIPSRSSGSRRASRRSPGRSRKSPRTAPATR